MKAIVLALLFVAAAAHADGVPLISPATATAANRAWFAVLSKEAWVASVTPVKINPNALESNVITVNIEGKDYRFVGMKDVSSGPTSVNGVLTQHTVVSWSGVAGPDTSASLLKGESGVYGTLFVNLTTYWLNAGALVKTKSVPTAPLDRAAMDAFHQAEQDELNKKAKPWHLPVVAAPVFWILRFAQARDSSTATRAGRSAAASSAADPAGCPLDLIRMAARQPSSDGARRRSRRGACSPASG